MKLSTTALIIHVVTVNSHHCNEIPCFWSRSRTGRSRMHGAATIAANSELDLIHCHDMHSFTGTEGIDHELDAGKNAAACEQGKSRGHKHVMKTKSDPMHRQGMHSFTGFEGMDHSDAVESSVMKQTRRRVDNFRTHHQTKTVKEVKRQVQVPKEEVAGKRNF